jgi:hypothetical protein
MKRRDLLIIGAFSALAAVAGTGFLKTYKHQTRENELLAMNEYAALLTHEIDHLNGILFIDSKHAGIDT